MITKYRDSTRLASLCGIALVATLIAVALTNAAPNEPTPAADSPTSHGPISEEASNIGEDEPRINRAADQSLLESKEDGAKQTVLIETQILVMDSKTFDQQIAPRLSEEAELNTSATILSDQELTDLQKSLKGNKSVSVVATPRLVTLNRQRGVIEIGKEIPYVSDLRRVEGGDGDKLMPVLKVAKEGLSLSIEPTIGANPSNITTSLEVEFTSHEKMMVIPWPDARAGEIAMIQAPLMHTHSVSTTLMTPSKSTILLSLGKLNSDFLDGIARDSQSNAILLITVTKSE